MCLAAGRAATCGSARADEALWLCPGNALAARPPKATARPAVPANAKYRGAPEAPLHAELALADPAGQARCRRSLIPPVEQPRMENQVRIGSSRRVAGRAERGSESHTSAPPSASSARAWPPWASADQLDNRQTKTRTPAAARPFRARPAEALEGSRGGRPRGIPDRCRPRAVRRCHRARARRVRSALAMREGVVDEVSERLRQPVRVAGLSTVPVSSTTIERPIGAPPPANRRATVASTSSAATCSRRSGTCPGPSERDQQEILGQAREPLRLLRRRAKSRLELPRSGVAGSRSSISAPREPAASAAHGSHPRRSAVRARMRLRCAPASRSASSRGARSHPCWAAPAVARELQPRRQRPDAASPPPGAALRPPAHSPPTRRRGARAALRPSARRRGGRATPRAAPASGPLLRPARCIGDARRATRQSPLGAVRVVECPASRRPRREWPLSRSGGARGPRDPTGAPGRCARAVARAWYPRQHRGRRDQRLCRRDGLRGLRVKRLVNRVRAVPHRRADRRRSPCPQAREPSRSRMRTSSKPDRQPV